MLTTKGLKAAAILLRPYRIISQCETNGVAFTRVENKGVTVEQRVNSQNANREGKPFIIYALVCPITLDVKYVGQTVDLDQRTRSRTHTRSGDPVAAWLSSLGRYLRPHRVILEQGINRVVRVKVTAARKPGAGRTPF